MRIMSSHRACHLAICAALSIAADAALAEPLTVTNCHDDSRAGSLRTVISGAASGDTIDLSGLPGADSACTSSRITLTQGQIPVSGALTVIGPEGKTRHRRQRRERHFQQHRHRRNATLRDITVTDGTIRANAAAASIIWVRWCSTVPW